MIKIQTIGGIEATISNPVLTSETDVKVNQFITVDGELYLVSNTIVGDDSYFDDVTIKAGQYINGSLVSAWVGYNLVADEKHVTYAGETKYKDIANNTIFTVSDSGNLKVAEAAPETGVYFKVVDKCKLTQNAFVIKVCVAVPTATSEETH